MLEISNLTTEKLDKKFFGKIAALVLKKEKKAGAISLVLVSSQKIKYLNKRWRKIDKATDVLSFCFEAEGDGLLGEIYLCPEFIRMDSRANTETQNEDEARKQKVEIARSFIHGMLHLLGYDHRNKKDLEKMINLENKYIKKLFN